MKPSWWALPRPALLRPPGALISPYSFPLPPLFPHPFWGRPWARGCLSWLRFWSRLRFRSRRPSFRILWIVLRPGEVGVSMRWA